MAKKKVFLKRDEMVASYFLMNAWGHQSKVANALGVSSQAISELHAAFESAIAGEPVPVREKHRQDYEEALSIVVEIFGEHNKSGDYPVVPNSRRVMGSGEKPIVCNSGVAKLMTTTEELNALLAKLPILMEKGYRSARPN